jgi:hypothetical protein
MAKLNQLLAIEKDLKAKNEKALTAIYQALGKEELFLGRVQTYRSYDEQGQKLPDQRQLVQSTAEGILRQVTDSRARLYDVIFSKDKTNTSAHASVKVNGTVLLQDVPVSTLLYLEKQLIDLQTVIGKIPTLASDKVWTFDPNTNMFVTDPVKSWTTKKVPKTLVKVAATTEHPAQTEVYHEDIQVGEWTTIHHSGAMPAERKVRILDRIAELREAVKFAREEANAIAVQDVAAGQKIFDFLFAK